MKVMKKVLVGIVAVIVALAVACVVYLNSGAYAADDKALAALSRPGVTAIQKDGYLLLEPAAKPKGETRGLVFYQGAKVDSEAYLPFMVGLVEKGWTVALPQLPLRFALLDVNAADRPLKEVKGVDRWYVGGHSLGGVAASSYAGKHADQLEGLILVGSYANNDLSQTNLNLVCIQGSNDGVLNFEKHDQSAANHPPNAHELTIRGGNHAQFGSYGPQEGDNPASISPEEQVAQAIAFIEACCG